MKRKLEVFVLVVFSMFCFPVISKAYIDPYSAGYVIGRSIGMLVVGVVVVGVVLAIVFLVKKSNSKSNVNQFYRGPAQKTTFCTKCGSPVGERAAFCSKCGASLLQGQFNNSSNE